MLPSDGSSKHSHLVAVFGNLDHIPFSKYLVFSVGSKHQKSYKTQGQRAEVPSSKMLNPNFKPPGKCDRTEAMFFNKIKTRRSFTKSTMKFHFGFRI